MTEKTKETALVVRIEHENPIDSRALGYVLCDFSKEFDLFLMSSKNYEKYKNLALRTKKIEHGSIEIYFGIICNINVNIEAVDFLLPLFFVSLKESCSKLKEPCSKLKKELAKFILRFKAKINFEIEISGNKTNESFSVDNKDAEEILVNNLKSELDVLRNELLLVKEKQKTLDETLDIIANVLCDKNDSNNLKSELNTLKSELLSVKDKQVMQKEAIDILTVFCDKNDSTESEEVPE